MLKSTYTSANELPPGWTQHRAPSGHLYYYNAETKKSTYKRPVATPDPVAAAAPQPYPGAYPPGQFYPSPAPVPVPGQIAFQGAAGYAGFPPSYPGFGYQQPFAAASHGQQQQQPRRKLEDRPKHKHPIPGHDGWFLIKTKLRRRFVWNSKTDESFWKVPEEIVDGVKEFDKRERERKERRARGEKSPSPEPEPKKEEKGQETGATAARETPHPPATVDQQGDGDDGSEYEEVEVTDDEGAEDEDTQNPSKRTRIDETDPDNPDPNPAAPLEFNEDDIAYQLAAMGAEYDLDAGEYGGYDDENWEEGAEGLPLSEEDTVALFRDLLEDHKINPYSPWERIIEEGKIIDDSRYTLLPNMKSRREVYGVWSKEKIAQLREARAKEEKKDPRIRYVAFLEGNVTGKLYWPEFKRKFKKSEEMRDMKLSDKEKEKMYRDHIARLKLPESKRVEDLKELLKSVPLELLNRDTAVENLPTKLLVDLRYISFPPATRDALIQSYISSLPEAPQAEAGEVAMSLEEREEAEKKRAEREKREQALRERERRVEMEKQKTMWEQRSGKQMLRREEMEVERAMRVGGEGIRGYVEEKEKSKAADADGEMEIENEPDS
ncbi:hypothetical protein KEM56_001469 [Ascosphaera pollenicola]|nr:hypothetical protein KEM56_001469 [Ascosphaera pollenicola]